MAGRWRMNGDGTVVKLTEWSADSPTTHPFEPGYAPLGFVRNPSAGYKLRERRYDKVSDADVAKLEREEESRIKAIRSECGAEACVNKAIDQLRTGQIQVDPRIDKLAIPTDSHVDNRGVTHIIPRQ